MRGRVKEYREDKRQDWKQRDFLIAGIVVDILSFCLVYKADETNKHKT